MRGTGDGIAAGIAYGAGCRDRLLEIGIISEHNDGVDSGGGGIQMGLSQIDATGRVVSG